MRRKSFLFFLFIFLLFNFNNEINIKAENIELAYYEESTKKLPSLTYIPDKNLQEALKEKRITIIENHIINNQVKNFLELDLSYYKIESLIGIEAFTDLEFLNIRGNNINTLTPLLALDQLEIVKSANNRLSDSPLYTSDVDSSVEALREQGVAIHNAIFQQVTPTNKNEFNATYKWKTLIVIPQKIDIEKDGYAISSNITEEDLNNAIIQVNLFKNAINNLTPDDVWIDVDIYITESTHKSDIDIYQLNEGASFWLFPRQIDEIQPLVSRYDSILILHNIDNNVGYAGLGGYNSQLNLGFGSMRFDVFQVVEDMFFQNYRMSYSNRLEESHIDWGTLVMIHEFIHGLEFYGTDILNLPIWNLHDSAEYYSNKVEDDYGIYDFDRSLTLDILWYSGYLNGDFNPQTLEHGIVYEIFEKRPTQFID